MWCQHFSPGLFLEQTSATFAASLRGRAKSINDRSERDIALAWHTAAFSGAAQAGKLKKLSTYISKPPVQAQTADEVAAIFKSLKGKGKSVRIRKRPTGEMIQ
jgi:hypothetical protein